MCAVSLLPTCFMILEIVNVSNHRDHLLHVSCAYNQGVLDYHSGCLYTTSHDDWLHFLFLRCHFTQTSVSIGWVNVLVTGQHMWTYQWSLKSIMQLKVIVFNWSFVGFPAAVDREQNTFRYRFVMMWVQCKQRRPLEYVIDVFVKTSEATCKPAGASVACLLPDWLSEHSIEGSMRGEQGPGGWSNGCQQPRVMMRGQLRGLTHTPHFRKV